MNGNIPWCSGYHYCTTSFNKARTQVLRSFKSCWQRVGDSRWCRQEIRLNTFRWSAIPQKQLNSIYHSFMRFFGFWLWIIRIISCSFISKSLIRFYVLWEKLGCVLQFTTDEKVIEDTSFCCEVYNHRVICCQRWNIGSFCLRSF